MDDLTQQEIDELKGQYGPLFRVSIDGSPHYFRTLTRNEAVELGITSGYIESEDEEAIMKMAVVWPTSLDFESMPAGIPRDVAKQILERSGLAGPEWLNIYIERAREKQTAYHTISATICAAFTGLLPGDLDALPIETLMELVVQSEEILTIRAMVNAGAYSPLSFEDANREPTQQELDARLRAALETGDAPAGWIDRTKPSKNPLLNPGIDPRAGDI